MKNFKSFTYEEIAEAQPCFTCISSFRPMATACGLWPMEWDGRQKVRSSVMQGDLGAAPLLLQFDRSKLRWYSWWGVPSLSLPLGLYRAHYSWEETMGLTQNALQNLQLPAGLGALGALLPRDSNSAVNYNWEKQDYFVKLLDTLGLNF